MMITPMLTENSSNLSLPSDFARLDRAALIDSLRIADELERRRCADLPEDWLFKYARTRDEHDPTVAAKPFPGRPLRGIFLMSFLRHGEIYHFDEGAIALDRALAHRNDEFPAGYSLAGCAPAEPASASPAEAHRAGRKTRSTIEKQRTAGSVLIACLTQGDNPRPSLEGRVVEKHKNLSRLAFLHAVLSPTLRGLGLDACWAGTFRVAMREAGSAFTQTYGRGKLGRNLCRPPGPRGKTRRAFTLR